MMTDPVADMLTRIRNASAVERPATEMPATKLKVGIAEALRSEGFIDAYEVGTYTMTDEGEKQFKAGSISDPKPILRVRLKYGAEGERVIRHIERASKPGRRLYVAANRIPRVLDGLGIAILSTSKGVMSSRQARAAKMGGELLCTVW